MSVPVGGRGVGPQVNDFEQVPSDNHQMSLAGVGVSRSGEPREGGYVWGWTQGGSRGGVSRGGGGYV